MDNTDADNLLGRSEKELSPDYMKNDKNKTEENNGDTSYSNDTFHFIKEGIYLLIASFVSCITIPILAPAIVAFLTFYMIHKRNLFKHMILPTLVGALIAFVIIVVFMKVPMFIPEIVLYATNIELLSSPSNIQFLINTFITLIVTVMNMAVFLMVLTILHNRYGIHTPSDVQEDKLIEEAKKEESLLTATPAGGTSEQVSKQNTGNITNNPINAPIGSEAKISEESIKPKETNEGKTMHVSNLKFEDTEVDNEFEQKYSQYKNKNKEVSGLGTEENEEYELNQFVNNRSNEVKSTKTVRSLNAEFEEPENTGERKVTKTTKVKTAKVKRTNKKSKTTTSKSKKTKTNRKK